MHKLILRSAAFKCWQERKEEFPLQSSKLRRVHEFGVSESLGEGKPTKLFMGPRAPSRISNRFGTHHCVNPPKIRFNPQCSYVSFNMSSYRNLSGSLWFLFSVSAQPNSNKWSLAGPWLNTTYLPMWQKRPSGAIWMPHHKAAVGKPDVRRSLGGDLPLDIQQKAWCLKGTWNLEIFGASLKSILKLSWRYFYHFRHFSVEMSWCRVLRIHVSTIHRGGVHSLEFHQDNPNPSYLWIRRLSQRQQFNRSIWYPLVNIQKTMENRHVQWENPRTFYGHVQ